MAVLSIAIIVKLISSLIKGKSNIRQMMGHIRYVKDNKGGEES